MQVETKEKKKSPTMKKRQNKKNKIRIYCVCMQPFKTSRSDAEFCSVACRQHAFINGIDYGESKSLAEYILIRELNYRFKFLINAEGKVISNNELYGWMDQSETVKRLLFPFLNMNSYYVKLYCNVLDPFYEDAKNNHKNKQYNSFQNTILPEWKVEMTKFIKMYEDLQNMVHEPVVIVI